MIKKNSLSFRIVLRILLITISLFVLTIAGYYYFTRNIIRTSAQTNAKQLAGNIAGKIAQQLQPMEKIPQMLSATIELGFLQTDSLHLVLHKILEKNENIFGASVAFQPGLFPEKGTYFMPYAFRKEDSIKITYLGGSDYEYNLMDWYQIPAITQKPYWSEPYYDEGGGNILTTTYSVPFFMPSDSGKVFAGVATVDVALEWLTDLIAEAKVFESGYAFVLTRNGMALTHPDKSMIMNESIFSNAENWGEPILREIGRDLMQGKSNFREYNLKGRQKQWIYYTNLPAGKLSLAVIYPDSEMFAPLKKLNLILLIFIGSGLFLLIISVVNVVNRMASPLVQITQSARNIAKGDFKTSLPVIKSKDELLELRNAFSYMQDQLAEYVLNLTETTAAKEKIDSELRIARDIQMSMIPHSFPPYPDLPQIDLFAELKSAKEVGGDLYDFFLTDQKKFCFAIGDVSGKGVPASLFMAVTRTLLRSIADKYKTPSSIIRVLNKSLALNNDSCMFVTFFLGILDLETGKLAFSNAGHNPPIIVKKEGEASFLIVEPSIPLGLQEEYPYTEAEIEFGAGDKIFTYTDGVSEAENASQKLFGEEAILRVVREHTNSTPQALIECVDRALEQHVKGYAQSDDITMLTISFNG